MPTVTNFSRYLSSHLDRVRQTDPVMPRRPLGVTGLSVGVIGLGTAALDHPGPSGAPDEEALEILEIALDMQASLIDLAVSRESDRALRLAGKVLRRRRAQAAVCLRIPGGPEDLGRGLDQALETLGTDHVDVLLWDRPVRTDLEGRDSVWEVLAGAKRAGKALCIGAAVEAPEDLLLAARRTPSEALRFPLNVFDQSHVAALAEAGSRGLGLIAARPLDSGWLTGRYGRHHVFLDSRRRWSAEDRARRAEAQAEFERLAVGPGATAAQAALSFVLSFPQVSCAVPSASAWQHVIGNVDAPRLRLAPSVVEGLRGLWSARLAGDPLVP